MSIIKRMNRDIEQLNHSGMQFTLSQNKLTYKLYTFMISQYYPFKEPKLLIQDTEYINYFIHKYILYKKNIPFLNLKCPCCFNVSCNWYPSYNFKKMFDEYIDYNLGYSNVFKFLLLYKLQRFDDLIYNHILEFIYHN